MQLVQLVQQSRAPLKLLPGCTNFYALQLTDLVSFAVSRETAAAFAYLCDSRLLGTSLSRRTMMIDGSLIARMLILIVELLTKMKSQMRTRNVWGFLECGLKISLGSVVQGKWRRWYYSSNCCGMLGFLSRFLGSSTDRFVWSMTCMHCVNGKKIVLW